MLQYRRAYSNEHTHYRDYKFVRKYLHMKYQNEYVRMYHKCF